MPCCCAGPGRIADERFPRDLTHRRFPPNDRWHCVGTTSRGECGVARWACNRRTVCPTDTGCSPATYPPNELGYCGPAGCTELLQRKVRPNWAHTRGSTSAWPYLDAIARAVSSGSHGPRRRTRLLGRRTAAGSGRPVVLLAELRGHSKGQVTRLLDDVHEAQKAPRWHTTASMCSSSIHGSNT